MKLSPKNWDKDFVAVVCNYTHHNDIDRDPILSSSAHVLHIFWLKACISRGFIFSRFDAKLG